MSGAEPTVAFRPPRPPSERNTECVDATFPLNALIIEPHLVSQVTFASLFEVTYHSSYKHVKTLTPEGNEGEYVLYQASLDIHQLMARGSMSPGRI
eukprot:62119-Pyramimonas_sp.AAC.2